MENTREKRIRELSEELESAARAIYGMGWPEESGLNEMLSDMTEKDFESVDAFLDDISAAFEKRIQPISKRIAEKAADDMISRINASSEK